MSITLRTILVVTLLGAMALAGCSDNNGTTPPVVLLPDAGDMDPDVDDMEPDVDDMDPDVDDTPDGEDMPDGEDDPVLEGLAIEPAELTLRPEQTQALVLNGTFDDDSTEAITEGITWESSDDAIVMVDDAGVVTAVAPGGATITATVGDLSATAQATVEDAPPFEPGVVFDDDFGPGVTFEEFGGSANDLNIDEAMPGEGAASLAITVPAEGYTGGAFKGPMPQDLSGFNAIQFMARASEAKTLNVAGLGNNAAVTTFQVELGGIALTPEWATFIIPIPNPERLTAEDGLFHFAEGSDEGAYTIWFDNIRFVNLPAEELGMLMPSIATETRRAAIGDSFVIPGTSVTIMRDGVPSVYATAPSYFDFNSSDEDVATVGTDGTVSVDGNGTAIITATLAGAESAGAITVEAGEAALPGEPAPVPQDDPADVISLFSDAFVNEPVDTFSAEWDNADVEDFAIGDDNTKRYSNLLFAGIEFTSEPVDATEMTHFRMDIWSPNATTFNIKLVDFGPNGVFQDGGDENEVNDDSEFELAYTAETDPAIVNGQWISFDIPLSDFAGLTGRTSLAQLIIVSDSSTVFVDNVYFRRGEEEPPVMTPGAPAPAPEDDPADVISLFSDAFDDVPVDTFSAVWDNAEVADFAIGEDNTKHYSALTFAGIEFTTEPVDATDMTHFRMDIWTPDATTFNIKLVDFGPNGVFQDGGDENEVNDDSEHELAFTAETDPAVVTGQWISFDIPLDDFVNMTGRTSIAQLIIVSDNSNVFVDNIYFRGEGDIEPPGDPGVVFGDDFAPGVTFEAFGGSTNDLNVDDVMPGEGETSLAITVPGEGYTGGAFKAAEPMDLSGFNAVRFMARASEARTLNVAGFGNNAASNVFQVEFPAIALTTEWAMFTIPIPNPARLTAEDGLFHFAEGSDEGAYTIWFDNIHYVNLPAEELGTLMPAMATETRQVAMGDSFVIPGTSVTIMRDGVPSVYATAPSYFDFTSSDEDVATVEPNGTVSIVGFGTAVIEATMAGLPAAGAITVEAALAMVPEESAPAPQDDPADVISLFSDAFDNVLVDVFSTVWGNAQVEDFAIGDDNIKRYSGLGFTGIEMTTEPVDATDMTHFRMDIWSPDATTFNIKLVDFGPNGVFQDGGDENEVNDDSEHELAFTADTDPAVVNGQWISFDIPLDAFVNMTGRTNIAQIVIVSSGATVFVDNIYFRGEGGVEPPGDPGVVFGDDFAPGVTFEAFGGSTNDLAIDAMMPGEGAAALSITVPDAGYTGGAFKAAEPMDLSGFNAVRFMARASDARTLNVAGFGNNAASNVFQVEFPAIALTTDWAMFTIPIPNPARLTAEDGLFHFAEGSDEGAYTIWFDNIHYVNLPAEELGVLMPAMATETRQAAIGDSFVVPGTSVTIMRDGVPSVYATAPSYFDFTSSDEDVAMVEPNGTVNVVGAGAAVIEATMAGLPAAGAITVEAALAMVPEESAPAPQDDPADVISLFSDAFDNVLVDVFSTVWGNAQVEDFAIGDDNIKRYSGLGFTGIEMTTEPVDATDMTHFRMDIWSPDATTFNIKLVDFGPNGVFQNGGDENEVNDDSEHELTFSVDTDPAIVNGQWISFDLPLDDFVNMTGRTNIAQIVIVSSGATVFVDNIYFRGEGGVEPPGDPGVVFGDDFAPGVTFEAFGGSTNDLNVDDVMPGEGETSLAVTVPEGGYTGGAFKAAEPMDLSGFNAVRFMARASDARTLNVAGLGNNAASNIFQVEFPAIALTTDWAMFTIPIPNPARLTAEDGLFHFAEGSDEGAYTIWFDNIHYVNLPAEELGVLMPAMATETRQAAIGDSFVVPGTSVTIMRDGVPSVYATAPSYFDFTSSDEDVATVEPNGTISVIGNGTAVINATMAGLSVTGAITLEAAAPMLPEQGAPAPQDAPADVISLFSDAFMNNTVDTFSAVWDSADVEDFAVGNDNTKRYSNLVFAGIEFTSSPVDATEMTHFRMDIWTPNAATFNIKLVDFGPNGVFQNGGDENEVNDDSEHELAFTVDTDPAIVTGQWISFDIPLDAFVNMTGRTSIAQLIVVSNNSTVFVDNVYFRR